MCCRAYTCRELRIEWRKRVRIFPIDATLSSHQTRAMKRKKKTKNTETTANNTLEHKLRELGVELNTDATKLNNLSRLLSALISSSPPPSLRKGRDDDTFKVDCYEKDEEEKKKQSVHQKGKVECILALEKFFCKRLARGDVEQANFF